MANDNKLNNYRYRAFIICCFLLQIRCFPQNSELNYKHVWVEDGLSQSTIFSIYKDRKGFMWFGTRRGLNRYDGYEFVQYMHDFSDSNSLSSDIIRTIIGDSKDNLLIQTYDNVNYFDRYKNKFIKIPAAKILFNMEKDRQGTIWTCSADGLFVFNEKKLQFDTIKNEVLFLKISYICQN